MESVHSIIRRELCSLVSGIWPEASAEMFDMDCPGGEVSAPLGYKPGPNAEIWRQRLREQAETTPPTIFGAKLIKDISCSNGHLLFHLSDEAYSAILTHIIKNYKKPQIPGNTEDIASYATARMLMLSRKGGCGCPDVFKKGIWLCLCVEGFEGKKREAVRKRAADALLCAMDGLSLAERDDIKARSGRCGDCAARLLLIDPN